MSTKFVKLRELVQASRLINFKIITLDKYIRGGICLL